MPGTSVCSREDYNMSQTAETDVFAKQRPAAVGKISQTLKHVTKIEEPHLFAKKKKAPAAAGKAPPSS